MEECEECTAVVVAEVALFEVARAVFVVGVEREDAVGLDRQLRPVAAGRGVVRPAALPAELSSSER